MKASPAYIDHHPRWHRTRVSTYWWLQRWSYLGFILREVSSAFVVWFVLFLLLEIRAVSSGADAYRQFVDWAKNPFLLALNVVTLFFIVYHAVTWFNLAPKAMVVHMGGRRVPGVWIAASNFAAWAVISAAIAWLVLR
jgi:fumarate reductase subunit C